MQLQKNNIRMVVQGPDEFASDFASRLEKYCYDLSVQYKDQGTMPPIVLCTASSTGRQTATIQFMTFEPDPNEHVFSTLGLTAAYEKFKEVAPVNEHTQQLFSFLVNFKRDQL